MCFFHAVVQERRKFRSLGWNKTYEFNESDLTTAFKIITDMLEQDTEEIVWDALQFVTGHIVYGGRVTDDIDRRCLMNILSTYICEDMLEESYIFDFSGTYTALKNNELSVDAMKAKVASLPAVDKPEIFGMNDNADIAFQR